MKTPLLLAAISLLALTSGAAMADDNDGKTAGSGVTNGRVLGVLLYRAAGARQSTGSKATSVSCSNFTGASQQVQIILRNYDFTTTNAYNITQTIPKNSNRTYSTQNTSWLSEDDSGDGLNTLNQGTLMIRGTSKDIHCSAWISDLTATTPAGATPLNLVRFNAATGSNE